MKRKLGNVFMIAGILCILIAMGILTYNHFENKNAQDQSMVIMESIVSAIGENEQQPVEEDPFDTEMLTKSIDGYDYIGYLFIPKLELELPVMADWDYNRLKISPCRYYGSIKTNNLVIAAHNYRSHFGYIGNLAEDDIIMFTDMEGKNRSYKVTSVGILQPTDVDMVKDTGDDLILYTCTYGGAERICVRCSLT